MNIHFPKQVPAILLSVTTVCAISLSFFALSSGWTTIFQNVYYFPIIIACAFYYYRGFLFSIVLSLFYFICIFIYTQDPSVLVGAGIRVVIFILVAGTITYLSILKERATSELAKRNFELQAAYEQIQSSEEELKEQLEEIYTAQQEIDEQEHTFRLLFENNIAGIALHEIICDDTKTPVDYRFIDVNPAFVQQTGLKKEEIIGKTVREVLPGTEQYWIEIYGKVALTGITAHFENYSRELNKYFEVTAYSPRQGQFATLVQDVTERIQKEIRLKETNEYLENLITYANVPILVWDASFHITRANHSFELLSGWSADDLRGKTLEILFPPESASHLMQLIRTNQGGFRWDTVRIPIQHREGGTKYLVWNSATISDTEGNPIATIAQGRDITQEILLEQEKEQLTLQIQENIAKLAILNDGIRNPLSIITTLTEMAGNKEYETLVYEQVTRINEMIQNLDKEWVKSVKILDYLRKYHHINKELDTHERVACTPEIPDGKNIDDVCNTLLQFDYLRAGEDFFGWTVRYIQETLFADYVSVDYVTGENIARTHTAPSENRQEESEVFQISDTLLNQVAGKCICIFDHDVHRSFPDDPLLQKLKTDCYIGVTIWSHTGTPVGVLSVLWQTAPQHIRRAEILLKIISIRVSGEIERMRADQQLKENEILNLEKYRHIFEDATIGIFQTTPDGEILMINDAMARMFGYENQDEIARLNIRVEQNLYHNPEQRRELLDELASGKPVFFKQITFRKKDGTLFTGSVNARSITDDTGRIIRYEGTILDITEHKRIEQAIAESEERFHKILDLVPDLISIHDPDMNIVYSNWNGFGRVPSDLRKPGLKCYFVYRGLDCVCPDCLAGTVLKTKKPIETEIKIPEGLWIDLRVIPLLDDQGEVILFMEWVRDITEKKLAEEELLEERQRLASIIAGTRAGTWEWNIKTGEVIINSLWAEMLGYSKEELSPVTIQTLERLTHPEDLPLVYQKFREHFDKKSPYYEAEFRMIHKNGQIVYILDRGRVLTFADDGSPHMMYGTHINITEKKNAELELFEANRKLHLLSDITRHDIRNALSSLLIFLDRIRLSSSVTDIQNDIDRIEQIAQLIQKAIEFTHDYQNIGVKKAVWHDIETMLQSVPDQIHTPGIKFTNTVSGIEIYADPLLERAIYNIIENALRYGGQGISEIRSYGICTSDDESFSWVIEDDGVGIKENEKPYLFEHGYGKNTGFGLFFTREILTITGISIEENGISGSGARFEIHIPPGKWRRKK